MGEPAIRFSDLTEEDLSALPTTFSELTAIVGGDTALKLCLNLGGTGIYFPKLDALLRNIRNRKIKNDFDGSNHRRLALQYNLSEKTVREILNNDGDHRQDSLF